MANLTTDGGIATVAAAMPTAYTYRIVKFLKYLFIYGKFYTLFSLLFGTTIPK